MEAKSPEWSITPLVIRLRKSGWQFLVGFPKAPELGAVGFKVTFQRSVADGSSFLVRQLLL